MKPEGSRPPGQMQKSEVAAAVNPHDAARHSSSEARRVLVEGMPLDDTVGRDAADDGFRVEQRDLLRNLTVWLLL